jgi:hypothetical protein
MAESEGAAASEDSEQTMNLKALVIGGTGAVGKCLVGELLSSKVKIKLAIFACISFKMP